MRPDSITLALFEKYTPEELTTTAQQMAQAQADYETVEVEKKVSDAAFNERMKKLSAAVSELAKKYNKGARRAKEARTETATGSEPASIRCPAGARSAAVIAFLYARVSTGEQNEGMQVREMLELAKRHSWDTEVFIDAGWSGAKEKRPELDRMMSLVRRGKCDVVMVYRFDRFARSTRQLVNALEEFRQINVQFVSVHEAIDTTSPMGKFAFDVFAAMAEFERSLIRERVRSGMAHAKANGRHVGRPALGLNYAEIIALREQGLTWEAVAANVGGSESAVRKFAQRQAEKGSEKPATGDADSKALAKAVEN